MTRLKGKLSWLVSLCLINVLVSLTVGLPLEEATDATTTLREANEATTEAGPQIFLETTTQAVMVQEEELATKAAGEPDEEVTTQSPEIDEQELITEQPVVEETADVEMNPESTSFVETTTQTRQNSTALEESDDDEVTTTLPTEVESSPSVSGDDIKETTSVMSEALDQEQALDLFAREPEADFEATEAPVDDLTTTEQVSVEEVITTEPSVASSTELASDVASAEDLEVTESDLTDAETTTQTADLAETTPAVPAETEDDHQQTTTMKATEDQESFEKEEERMGKTFSTDETTVSSVESTTPISYASKEDNDPSNDSELPTTTMADKLDEERLDEATSTLAGAEEETTTRGWVDEVMTSADLVQMLADNLLNVEQQALLDEFLSTTSMSSVATDATEQMVEDVLETTTSAYQPEADTVTDIDLEMDTEAATEADELFYEGTEADLDETTTEPPVQMPIIDVNPSLINTFEFRPFRESFLESLFGSNADNSSSEEVSNVDETDTETTPLGIVQPEDNEIVFHSNDIVDIIRNFIAEQDPMLELFLTVCFVHPTCYQLELPTPSSELGQEGREILQLLKERRQETARQKLLERIDEINLKVKEKMFKVIEEEVGMRGVSIVATKTIIDSVKDEWLAVKSDLDSIIISLQEIFSMGVPVFSPKVKNPKPRLLLLKPDEDEEDYSDEYNDNDDDDNDDDDNDDEEKSEQHGVQVVLAETADILGRIPDHVEKIFRLAAKNGYSRYRKLSAWDSWKLNDANETATK